MIIKPCHALSLLLGGAVFLASQSNADAQAAVEGAGSVSCQQLSTARDTTDHGTFSSAANWVFGYLTAAGGYLDETFDLTPWQSPDTIMAQIMQYCDANPDERLVNATVAYVEYLIPNRLTAPSEIVALRQGSEAVRIYADLIPTIQEQLSVRGFYEGLPSGSYDAATADAIRALQRHENLPVNGLPDGRTLVHIFR